MDAEKLNKALYDKMAAEQERFKHGLLGQTPEEVLNHAYEYAMREDILMEMEALDLPAPQAAALLASPFPLADVYKDFRNMETGHMDILRECIEARADTMLEAKREATRAIPIYQQSGEYAREHGELDAFRTSRKANEACRDAIDAAIRDGYDGTYLRQEVGDLGGTIRASGHLGHTVAVCCLYKENCALHGSAAVCVTLPNGEVWPLIVLQNDGAVLTGE